LAIWPIGSQPSRRRPRHGTPYVYEGQPTDPPAGQSTWLVPAGELFVLGDHRAASQDSRVFGFIQR
jgi:type IV secretory pathway protease TraF